MWLVEAMGMDKWQQTIEQYMGEGTKLAPAVHVRGRTTCIPPTLVRETRPASRFDAGPGKG